MQENLDKIKSILEILPYIKEFSGKTIVIKYGGAAMVEEGLKESFAEDIALLKYVGVKPVIVHGGGPEINSLLKKLNIQTEFIRGHRVTDIHTMEAVEMVLSGKLNKQITGLLNKKNMKAVGISGRDGRIAISEIQKMKIKNENGMEEDIDLGLVGDVPKIHTQLIDSLIKEDFIPVISPVTESGDGRPLNVNADTMAGAISGALGAEKLILLTDTEGIIIKGKLMDKMKQKEVLSQIDSGEISGGMIPKVECCLDALRDGVKKVHIIDGRVAHSILIELFTDSGIGTMIEL